RRERISLERYRRRCRLELVGPLDCGRSCPVDRRFCLDRQLADSPDSNGVCSELFAGGDPPRFYLFLFRFFGDPLMDFFRQHILTIVAFWPLAGMIVLLFFNKENKTLIRTWANFVIFAGFFISLPLWFWFDRGASDQMQFVENVSWIQTLGAHYHVGIDGISLLLVMLTTLLGPLAVLSSWTAIENRMKEYYVFMLMLQAGLLRAFLFVEFLPVLRFLGSHACADVLPDRCLGRAAEALRGDQVLPVPACRICPAAPGDSGTVLQLSFDRGTTS